jgi:hypothetical protein
MGGCMRFDRTSVLFMLGVACVLAGDLCGICLAASVLTRNSDGMVSYGLGLMGAGVAFILIYDKL